MSDITHYKIVRLLSAAVIACAALTAALLYPAAAQVATEPAEHYEAEESSDQGQQPQFQRSTSVKPASGQHKKGTSSGSGRKVSVVRPPTRIVPASEQEYTETEDPALTGETDEEPVQQGAKAEPAPGTGLGTQSDDGASPPPSSGPKRSSVIKPAAASGAADQACRPLFWHRPEEMRGKAGVADVLIAGRGPSHSAVSRHILLNGKYLYVSGEPGLQTISVADPERMALTSDWTKSSPKMNGSAVKGNILYVTNWSPHEGLLLFDISNPAKPVHIKTLATPLHSWDAVVNGNLLDVSVGAETKSAIVTYDIKDPRNPVHLNTLAIDDRLIGNASRYKGYLYFTHKQFLYVYDASDPAKPRPAGQLAFAGLCGETKVRGGHLYMLENGLHVFSLGDPGKPAQKAYLKLDEARGMHFQGNQVYVPASGSGIYTVDVSNPAAPKVVSNWAAAWPGMGHGGYPVTADGSGSYVFIGTTGGNNPGCAGASCACYGGRIYSVRR